MIKIKLLKAIESWVKIAILSFNRQDLIFVLAQTKRNVTASHAGLNFSNKTHQKVLSKIKLFSLVSNQNNI